MKINILNQINKVIYTIVPENNNIEVTEEMEWKDIPNMDSINYVILIVEIEKLFNIKFTSYQIYECRTVGRLVNCLTNELKII